MFRKLSKKQLGRFLLTIGMMVGLSIVGCAPAQPARQASPPSASQPGASASQAECQKLRASVKDLEDALARATRVETSTTESRRIEAELTAAQQKLAKCS